MSGTDSFPDYFSSFAGRYADARPTYPEALFQYISAEAPDHRCVWDCATGNGQAAVGLAIYFDEVQATDASEEQILNASRLDNIVYSTQRAERTNFPTEYFDAVTIAQALHWFDLNQFAIEVDRVLKPGGVIVAWVYGFFRVSPDIDAVFERVLKQPIEHLWKPGNVVAKSGYANVRLPWPAIDVPNIDMRCTWNLAELMNYVSSWSALNRYTDEHGPEILHRTTERLEPLWGDPDEKKSIVMDFYIRGWRKE